MSMRRLFLQTGLRLCGLSSWYDNPVHDHIDLVGELSAVQHISIVAGVNDVADSQLLPFILRSGTHNTVADLDLQARTSPFADVTPLPLEGTRGYRNHVVTRSLNIEHERTKITGLDVYGDRILNGNRVTGSRETIDSCAALNKSADDFE